MRENRRMIDDDTFSLEGPTAPRALSIDEEWAIIQALDVERVVDAHAIAPTSTTHVEDLSYLEPILNQSHTLHPLPASSCKTRSWRWRWWRLIAAHNLRVTVSICEQVAVHAGLALVAVLAGHAG